MVNFIYLFSYPLESALWTLLRYPMSSLTCFGTLFWYNLAFGDCNTADSVISLFSTSVYEYHVFITFIVLRNKIVECVEVCEMTSGTGRFCVPE